jgi:hypothetical protein
MRQQAPQNCGLGQKWRSEHLKIIFYFKRHIKHVISGLRECEHGVEDEAPEQIEKV